MYKLLTISILCLVMTSCEPKVLPTVIDVQPSEITVKFSHMSTMMEVAQAAMFCSEQGVDMQYVGSEFFDDGRIRKLSLQVTLPNKSGGKTSADVTNLQYSYYGFTLSKEGRFKIGQLD